MTVRNPSPANVQRASREPRANPWMRAHRHHASVAPPVSIIRATNTRAHALLNIQGCTVKVTMRADRFRVSMAVRA